MLDQQFLDGFRAKADMARYALDKMDEANRNLLAFIPTPLEEMSVEDLETLLHIAPEGYARFEIVRALKPKVPSSLFSVEYLPIGANPDGEWININSFGESGMTPYAQKAYEKADRYPGIVRTRKHADNSILFQRPTAASPVRDTSDCHAYS
jgi:hypothetical protein